MEAKVKCPFCKTELAVGEEYAGMVVQCPVCSDYFKLPAIRRCPVCGDSGMDRRKLCIQCGYQFGTGEILTTASESVEVIPRWRRILGFLVENMPGLFRVPTVLGFIVCLVVSLLLAGFGLMIFTLAPITGFFVLVSTLMVYMQGVAFLCSGELCALKSACFEMTGSCWSLFLLLSFLPVGVILFLMFHFAPATS